MGHIPKIFQVFACNNKLVSHTGNTKYKDHDRIIVILLRYPQCNSQQLENKEGMNDIPEKH